MFRSYSPFADETNSYAESIQSNGYSGMSEGSSQISSVSKPSAKSIYMQRKEYAETLNKMMEKFQYKVEHLLTCHLNGKELRNVNDCLERLRLLDGMGRLWAQSMQLEIEGSNLLLTDVDSKEELESMALTDILELKAVPDAGALHSLLTVMVRLKRKHSPTVLMFQCEEVQADIVERDFARVLSQKDDISINSNTGALTRHSGMENLHKPGQWSASDFYDDTTESELHVSQEEEEEEEEHTPTSQPVGRNMSTPRPYTELDRDIDILNHIASDMEIFMGKIAAVSAKSTKKKKKKGKVGMPLAEEFADCLQKIKYGFNLVAELNGKISNPSAPEFVQSFFSTLAFVVSHCPQDLPQTIVAPLLTPACVRLMSEVASEEDDKLWQSLGDPWNIPSTQWPEDYSNIPIYTLEFFDGWEPPEVTAGAEARPPVERQDSPKSANPAPSQNPAKWTPARMPQNERSEESQGQMRALYDFPARNDRELNVTKGELVELLDKSKKWWKVRNIQGEEGYVPNNVLEDAYDQSSQISEEYLDPPVLTRQSKPPEVKAWLEDKGFSQITVRCLGGLSGSMLLGMTREELKKVCPEEGGRVFFRLQAVRSSLANGI